MPGTLVKLKKKFDSGAPVDLDTMSELAITRPPTRWEKQKRNARRITTDPTRKRVRSWRPAHRKPGGVTLIERLAEVMEPGQWYARPDLAILSGARRKSVDFIVVWMRRRGLVEQGDNPDWREHVYRKGVGVHEQAAREPRYLFRLTPAGLEVKRKVGQ